MSFRRRQDAESPPRKGTGNPKCALQTKVADLLQRFAKLCENPIVKFNNSTFELLNFCAFY